MQTIQGKIVKFLPKQEGESSRGHWVKAGVVIEYGNEYPKKAAFSLFGEDRLLMCAGLSQGMEVQINYNPESREYQDRWYTDLNCISIMHIGQGNTQGTNQTNNSPAPVPSQNTAQTPAMSTIQSNETSYLPGEEDGLPF